jgi:hypothetical protein
MNPSEEFKKRAVECGHMAKFLRDPESREMWNRMAERWRRCAERYDSNHSPDHVRRMKVQRKSALHASQSWG